MENGFLHGNGQGKGFRRKSICGSIFANLPGKSIHTNLRSTGSLARQEMNIHAKQGI